VKAMQEWMREATITLNRQVGIEERERCEKCNEMDDDGERKGHARTKQGSALATINAAVRPSDMYRKTDNR